MKKAPRSTAVCASLFLVSSVVGALLIYAVADSRSFAQPATGASKSKPANDLSPYYEAIKSGTEATNLTDAQYSSLVNESLKTNLAARLWFRMWAGGMMSAQSATMAEELRVLETLREGRTNDAIRILEEHLDGHIISLAGFFREGDRTEEFRATAGRLDTLRWARDYRRKFPRQSPNTATDKGVAEAFSYLDKK